MITSIQIRNTVKEELKLLKEENQTFEDVIVSLLKLREMKKFHDRELVKKEAEELNKINRKISENLESVEDIGAEVVEW